MAIFAVEGGIGCGKTLTVVYLAMNDFKAGKNILTNINFKVRSKKIKYLNLYELKNMFDKVKDGSLDLFNSTIAIQEIHNYMDSRNSTSNQNKLLSYWILQSRHTGAGTCDIIYDTQELGQVDKRLRRNTDYILRPTITKKIKNIPSEVKVEVISKIGHKVIKGYMYYDVGNLINLYDTHQIVEF